MSVFQKTHGQKNQAARFVPRKSLKTSVLCEQLFPRLISRGLIEAIPEPQKTTFRVQFPRLISRGLIEAIRARKLFSAIWHFRD